MLSIFPVNPLLLVIVILDYLSYNFNICVIFESILMLVLKATYDVLGKRNKTGLFMRFYVNLARNWAMFSCAVAIGAIVLEFLYYPYFCLPCLLWAS